MNERTDDRSAERVVVRPEGEANAATPRASALGMAIFLASLSMLFAAAIVGYLVVRLRSESWPPEGSPGLPPTLWLGTLLALGCSAALELALRAVRAGNVERMRRMLGAGMLLAVFFLANQAWSWVRVIGAADFQTHLHGFGFVMLTGLHGAHALGGLVALVVVYVLALRGSYSWAHYTGVRNATLYWHYLSVVWLLLFGLLLAG